jgi:hypothetical protein
MNWLKIVERSNSTATWINPHHVVLVRRIDQGWSMGGRSEQISFTEIVTSDGAKIHTDEEPGPILDRLQVENQYGPPGGAAV